MNTQLAAEEEVAEFDEFEPESRFTGLNLRDGGTDLFRGVLVALVGLAVGALVLSQGFDGDNTESTTDDQSITTGELTAADPDAATLTSDEIGEDPDAPTAGGTMADGTMADDTAATDDAMTDQPGADDATTETSDPTAETTVTTSGLTDTARPAAEVQVVVLNATDQKGIAGRGTELLSAAGYNMVPAGNATTAGGSVIYYLEGYRADAIAVAQVFTDGLDGLVQAYDPTSPPAVADDLGDAKVIVVLGIDDAIPVG